MYAVGFGDEDIRGGFAWERREDDRQNGEIETGFSSWQRFTYVKRVESFHFFLKKNSVGSEKENAIITLHCDRLKNHFTHAKVHGQVDKVLRSFREFLSRASTSLHLLRLPHRTRAIPPLSLPHPPSRLNCLVVFSLPPFLSPPLSSPLLPLPPRLPTPSPAPPPPPPPIHPANVTMPSQLRLLDLQTEVLEAILSHLQPPGPYRRRAIISSPSSFPLSLTCRRFHSLFRSRLETIDALYPASYTPVATSTAYGPFSSSHLSSIVRLAGPFLKVLRLPRDCVDVEKVLVQIPIYGINLEELAYSNSNFEVDAQTVGALFSVAASWKRLNIFKPCAAFRYMVLARNLEELELTGIQPRYFYDLLEAFLTMGRKLRVLKLGFMPSDRGADPPYTMEPGWCITSLATFMSQHANMALPRLRVFEVNVSRSDVIYHLSAADRVGSRAGWVEHVSDLERELTRMREKNAGRTPVVRGLRQFTLRMTVTFAPHPSRLACLRMFEGMVGDCVQVEIQMVGATVVFPAGGGRGWFKALQITHRDLEYGFQGWGVDVGKIQLLDLGTNSMVARYERDGEFRERVVELLGRCAASVKEVRVEVGMNSAETMKMTCSYLADVLEKAAGVKRVYIRTGLVDFAEAGWDEFQRVMRSLGRIEVLRLTTHPRDSPECKMAFGKNLPLFLDEASKHCESLQCLFLESAMPVLAASIASREVREVAMKFYDLCMAAVERFEDERGNCDISTVRSQLARWFKDINPDPPLEAIMLSRGLSPTLGPWPPGLGPPPVLPPP